MKKPYPMGWKRVAPNYSIISDFYFYAQSYFISKEDKTEELIEFASGHRNEDSQTKQRLIRSIKIRRLEHHSDISCVISTRSRDMVRQQYVVCGRCQDVCFGEVVRAYGQHYHIKCFSCEVVGCSQDLLKDGFFTANGAIYCRKDYHKLMGKEDWFRGD